LRFVVFFSIALFDYPNKLKKNLNNICHKPSTSPPRVCHLPGYDERQEIYRRSLRDPFLGKAAYQQFSDLMNILQSATMSPAAFKIHSVSACKSVDKSGFVKFNLSNPPSLPLAKGYPSPTRVIPASEH